ncbi:hypothetical protein AAF712_016636 [Marasmius tenuissimus]|uniref:Short-chain dehydrogenase n=1 Tax=Marasmius tenuissimus TaxID=585030 RepID=A0ABR2Z6Z2_9AGAR
MILTQEQSHQEQLAGMPRAVEGVSLDGQVVVITGANTGLGFEVAKHFAIRGPQKPVIVCRSEEKGQDALNRIKTKTGFQNVELWTVDLNSFKSISAIKDKISQLERLDILVENAAIASIDYKLTQDGWDHRQVPGIVYTRLLSSNSRSLPCSLQSNVLGPALHIILHLPKLLDTAKKYPKSTPRIVLVSSNVHYWTTTPVTEALKAPNVLDFLNDKSYFDRNIDNRYPETKALDVMFVRALQQRLPNVTACSVNPGFCYSELARYAEGERAEHLRNLQRKLAFTTEEGSRQLLFAAIGHRDREAEVRGSYISFSQVSECSDLILSDDGQELENKLWTEILDLCGRVDGTAKEIIQTYLS